MRVMCINDKWIPSPQVEGYSNPAFGEAYVVIDSIEHDGSIFYLLAEFEPFQLFLSSMFVPLSDEPAEVIEEAELTHA